jgi:hypothetical protein
MRAPARKLEVMENVSWTYELPTTGAASEGLEEYEVRTADGTHVGVGLGLVEREGERLVLVDAGLMPPLLHRRIAVPWHDVSHVDHAALVVHLGVDRSALDDVALVLDPRQAVHRPGAEAQRVRLPDALTRPAPPGEGPTDRSSAIWLAVLAAAAPLSLFAVVTIWMARGLEGWEYCLLAIPFVLAAVAVALEGYRLFREPHLGHTREARSAAESRPNALPHA